MRNFVQPGLAITVPAPTGGVASGDVVVVGSLIGVAATAAPEGADVEIATTGVYTIPKKADDVFAIGDVVHWDADPGEATSTATGNVLLGVAVAVAAGPATTVRVRLADAFGLASDAALAALAARVTALEEAP